MPSFSFICAACSCHGSMNKKLRPLLAAFILFACFCSSGCGLLGFAPGQEEALTQSRKGTVVGTACSQIGKRYKSGGASPHKGFDCSGLVWWSYRQHGISVPRITVDQARAGKSVHKKHARAGDIVVFKTGNSPNGLHTGIYCGKGKFVHSPSSGKKVCMEKLDGGWWGKRLVAIRRISP